MSMSLCQRSFGLAWLWLLPLHINVANAQGPAVPVWSNGPDQSSNSACMIETHFAASGGLYMYADHEGFLEISVFNAQWSKERPGKVALAFTVDDQRIDGTWAFRDGPYRAVLDVPNIDLVLRRGTTLKLEGNNFSIAADLDGIEFAIEAVTGCVERTYGFAETEEEPLIDNIGDRLAEAVDGAQLQEPLLATFHCMISTENVLGFPSMQGNSSPTMETFGLTESGIARMNGRQVAPVRIETGQRGIEMAIFDIRQVIGAYSAISSSAPPLINMTPDEAAAYAALNGIGSSLVDQMLQGRQRFMVINLVASEVSFFDLSANNSIENTSSANCNLE